VKQYYYLVSSLYDLIIDNGREQFAFDDFFDLCESELNSKDFRDFKMMFLFNDIKNSVGYKKQGDKFITPSFYSESEFLENLKDTDSFLPFLSDFFYNKTSGKKNESPLSEIDNLTLLFYEDLDGTVTNSFIKDYYIFELNLKNINVAISLRKNGIDFKNKIIPYGDHFDFLLKNNSPDFGLVNEFTFIERLLSIYDKNHLIEIEKTIEEIRWDYLDSMCEGDTFGLVNILSYAIKMVSVKRWLSLSKERGKELLNRLVKEIEGNIKFPNEFK